METLKHKLQSEIQLHSEKVEYFNTFLKLKDHMTKEDWLRREINIRKVIYHKSTAKCLQKLLIFLEHDWRRKLDKYGQHYVKRQVDQSIEHSEQRFLTRQELYKNSDDKGTVRHRNICRAQSKHMGYVRGYITFRNLYEEHGKLVKAEFI
jgi:hypothetical protein